MESPDGTNPPGKLRTWWHPLLVRLLEWLLRDSCEVRDEVTVGRMPLRLDILLIRRLEIELPELALRDLPAICRRLNTFTLIEFKSPADSLERGDWNKLLGCAHLFVAQAESGIQSSELTLIILAPRLTTSFRNELQQSRVTIFEEEPGIHRVDGASFPAFVVETDRVAGAAEPALTVFSHEFVEHPSQFVASLKSTHADMLYYVMQQIERFRSQTPGFEGDHMTEKLYQTLEEMEESFINRLPIERLLKRASAEERLRGLTPEEMLRGLGQAERDRLRKLLEEQASSK